MVSEFSLTSMFINYYINFSVLIYRTIYKWSHLHYLFNHNISKSVYVHEHIYLNVLFFYIAPYLIYIVIIIPMPYCQPTWYNICYTNISDIELNISWTSQSNKSPENFLLKWLPYVYFSSYITIVFLMSFFSTILYIVFVGFNKSSSQKKVMKWILPEDLAKLILLYFATSVANAQLFLTWIRWQVLYSVLTMLILV